jgi:hypothetical protein
VLTSRFVDLRVNNSDQMLDLQNWSFARVLLVSVAWILLTLALVAAFLFIQLYRPSQSTGSGGIGAVSFGINALLAPLVLFGPPIGLTVIWFFLRRS